MTAALIRREVAADAPAVAAVLEEVFGRRTEVTLVERLRQRADSISVVALVDGEIVGHGIFHAVQVEVAKPPIRTCALGLLAVRSVLQSKGIGTQLVEAGISSCRSSGNDVMFVYGPSGFYRRFGFVPAIAHGLRSEWQVPDDGFFVLELSSGALSRVSGTVTYPREFDGA